MEEVTAKTFLNQWIRFCKSHKDCKCCSAYFSCPKTQLSTTLPPPQLDRERVDDIIKKIVDWAKKNPPKTYAQDFFEKFPNAKKLLGSAPTVCRKQIYPNVVSEFCSDADCVRCWIQSMEE